MAAPRNLPINTQGTVATRLTFLPGICEAFAVAGFSSWIFEMKNFGLGLSFGFILAAVSPAVVVGTATLACRCTLVTARYTHTHHAGACFDLKKAGYGVGKNVTG